MSSITAVPPKADEASPSPLNKAEGLVNRRTLLIIVLVIVVSYVSLFFFNRADLHNIEAYIQGTAWRAATQGDMLLARIWQSLGITNHFAAGIISLSLFTVALLLTLRKYLDTQYSLLYYVLIAFVFILAAIALGGFNDDIFMLSATVAFIPLGKRWWNEMIRLSGIAFYAFAFKDYWIVILGIYLLYRVVFSKIEFSRRNLVILVAITLLALAIAFNVVLGEPLDYGRGAMRWAREDVGSQILTLFPGGGFFGILVSVYFIFFTLLVPLPLFRLLTVEAVGLSVFWFLLWRAFWKSLPRINSSLLPSALFVMSYITVMATYTVDYGQATRHLVVVLPLALRIILDNYKNKNQTVSLITAAQPIVGATSFRRYSYPGSRLLGVGQHRKARTQCYATPGNVIV